MSEIEILYNCKECGIEKQPLNVPERAVAVDVVLWMNQAVQRVFEDHSVRRPSCPATKFDLMIPVNDGATMIGNK